MGDAREKFDKMTRVLLELKQGTRANPTALVKILPDIPRTTIREQILKLENKGTITGYTPIVTPETFGKPYLVRVIINPADYQFQEDAVVKVDALSAYFKEAVDQAPVAFYVYPDTEGRLVVNSVFVTHNCVKLLDRLSVAQNISPADIDMLELDRLEGIPNYSKYSLLEEGQQIVKP